MYLPADNFVYVNQDAGAKILSDSVDGTKPDSQYLLLPEAPPEQAGPVKAWEQDVEILTYAPAEPERNPMFLERRV